MVIPLPCVAVYHGLAPDIGGKALVLAGDSTMSHVCRTEKPRCYIINLHDSIQQKYQVN